MSETNLRIYYVIVVPYVSHETFANTIDMIEVTPC